MTLRSISVFLEPGGKEMSLNEMLSLSLTLLFILSISLAWTILWTKYFNKSIHVKNTFVQIDDENQKYETPLAQKMLWENIELLKNYDLY